MERICPLCNGLREKEEICPKCYGTMVDEGAIENYYDEYSPYLDKNISQELNYGGAYYCIHLFQCTQCNEDKRVWVDKELH